MNQVVRLLTIVSVLGIANTLLPSAFAQGCGGMNKFSDGKPGWGPKFGQNSNGRGRGCWWKNGMGQTGLNGSVAPWQQQYLGAYGSPYQNPYGSSWQQNVYGSLVQPNGYQNIFQQQMLSPQRLAWRQQLVQQFDLNGDGRLDKGEKSQLRQHMRNLMNARRSGQGLLTSTPQISPYAPYGNQLQNVGGFRARRGRI